MLRAALYSSINRTLKPLPCVWMLLSGRVALLRLACLHALISSLMRRLN